MHFERGGLARLQVALGRRDGEREHLAQQLLLLGIGRELRPYGGAWTELLGREGVGRHAPLAREWKERGREQVAVPLELERQRRHVRHAHRRLLGREHANVAKVVQVLCRCAAVLSERRLPIDGLDIKLRDAA